MTGGATNQDRECFEYLKYLKCPKCGGVDVDFEPLDYKVVRCSLCSVVVHVTSYEVFLGPPGRSRRSRRPCRRCHGSPGRRMISVRPPTRADWSGLFDVACMRPTDASIFGSHDRDWPRACVQRICKLAGVPVVGAHSMRGLHATLAMDAGITGTVVAASLGHEHVSTTMRSYAKGEAVAGASSSAR